jgi:hypothetical protein
MFRKPRHHASARRQQPAGRWRRAALLLMLALAIVPGWAPVRSAAWAAEAAFLSAVEDVPLMPGLVEVAGAATIFDAPQGRIVETFATGEVGADAIRSFYGQTLPQLGWTAAGATEFRREGERLTLEITPAEAATTVRFTLAPQ